jgi:glycosyltransferase involved in cell wall biosynthesis
MKTPARRLMPLADRGPLRVLFAITSMPVGGAETLLVNLCRRFNPERVVPEVCCLKEQGPLGEFLAQELPVHSRLLRNKWDFRVLGRLRKLIRENRIDAVVTVGAGDKMFWGRLAAWLEHLPVICSALHSTGWPDGVGRLNRWLTPVTDTFIAVAENHGRFLVEQEHFPAAKIRVIPNGIDTQRFKPMPDWGRAVRGELGIPETAPVTGIVAALRPEKNHELFLRAARIVRNSLPESRFLIIGNGPQRTSLEQLAASLELTECVHFLGDRSDIPQLLSAMDVFALTSRNEANPVSILEALACGVPVVATQVGSVHETVRDGGTGYLVESDDASQAADRWLDLLMHSGLRLRMGTAGRELVSKKWSLDQMVSGYELLLRDIYSQKCDEGQWYCRSAGHEAGSDVQNSKFAAKVHPIGKDSCREF